MPLPPRSLPNYRDTFLDYTKLLPTSPLFLEWAAYLVISGALTRRVWLQTNPTMPLLYPNLFAMNVGRPGTGKDVAMRPVRLLWMAVNLMAKEDSEYGLCVGAKSLSAKGLVDALASEGARLVLDHKGKKEHFHSLLICTPELGTLLPEFNPSLVSNICDLYNCDELFDDQIRNGRDALRIERPHITMLLGTQPSFLSRTFPVEAYGMGFFSRTILVFEEQVFKMPMFFTNKELPMTPAKYRETWNKLVSDLRVISRLTGEFKISREVKEAINKFHQYDSEKTALKHSRFTDYNTRRSLHAQKLAMCASVARSNNLSIEMEDWEAALDLLLRTEERMPRIFADLQTSGGFSNTVEDILDVSRNKLGEGLISEREIIKRLRQQHKPYEIKPIIKSMIETGELEPKMMMKGMQMYKVMHTKGKPKLKVV